MDLQEVFTISFRNRLFGGRESASGCGSDLAPTAIIRQEIPKLLKEISATTVLDAACGDFHWMKEVDLPVDKYIGVDIVSVIIENDVRLYCSPQRRTFVRADITTDHLPQADLILCRDCLVHLPLGLGRAAVLQFVASGSSYLLATTFTGCITNSEIVAGSWRALNLELPPFNFPKPLKLINEQYRQYGGAPDKCLGLWKLATLPTLE